MCDLEMFSKIWSHIIMCEICINTMKCLYKSLPLHLYESIKHLIGECVVTCKAPGSTIGASAILEWIIQTT